MTLKDTVAKLAETRAEIAKLKKRADELELSIIENMESKTMVLNGVGMVERMAKKDRTEWQHAELFSTINTMIEDIPNKEEIDFATGEIIRETDAQKGIRVVQELANPKWRVTALRNYDINPDEYCHAKFGGYSIRITEGIEG